MSRSGIIFDADDINNLRDICEMHSYIISKCDLSADDYETVLKTNCNLKKLISDLTGLFGQPM